MEEKKERPLGFCAFRPQPCSNRCHFFVKGMKCCVLHGINSNLGAIKTMLKAIAQLNEKK